jgi:uncharacterized protein (TIGR03437 family)
MVFEILKCRFFSLVAVLFLAGTSNGLFGQMLYVGNAGDNTVSAYVIDEDSGLLTEVLPRVASPGTPTSVAIHPSGQFVYVTNGGSPATGGPTLAAFSIDPNTGALTLLSSTPLVPGSGPAGAAIDPSGKFVLVAHNGANNVSVFSIDPSTGAVSPAPGSPFATPTGPNKVVVHPNGKFAYVEAAGAGQIAAFNLGADGSLTAVPGSPFAARNNLFWMAMDPAGKFLFAVERQDPAVLVYSVDGATGALTPVGSRFPLPPGSTPTAVAVDPAGKFLYVSLAGSGSVTVFNIGDTGALSQSGGFGAIITAFDAILDPSGKFLYVPGQQAGAVAGLAIDPNSGALSPLPQQFFPAGASPQRGATVLLSPPIIPPISADSAVNGFSNAPPGMPDAGIAPGSLLRVSGKNIGPAVEVQSPSSLSDFPLLFQLGGASIQIQSGDLTTAVIMRDVSNNQVAGIVPSTTPLGPATVTVTYKGRTTVPLPITIVTTSPGLETRNEAGSGPARRAWNASPDTVLNLDTVVNSNLPVNALNQSARPGQRMIVRATGLGSVAYDETQALTQELSVPLDVFVGNKPATVTTELRVIGLDYLLIQLPNDAPQGCYVPLAIRAGGITSNVATISISSTGGSCSDATGLAASDIDAAQASGGINLGTIVFGHIEVGLLGSMDFANGIFGRTDFNSLLSTFSPGNNQQGIRSSFPTPPLGTCVVTPGAPTDPNDPFNTPSDQTPLLFFNVGSALNLNGPQGAVQMTAPFYSFNPHGYVIKPGDYAFDNGTGSQAVGPFKAAITLPPLLTWTNQASLTAVDRTQDLTVTWSGGVPDKEFVMIIGLSANQATAGFLCTQNVSAGQFTVPAWVLSNLPATATITDQGQSYPGGILGVGTAPFSSVGRFTATGLDFGVLTYEQATGNLVYFQ